MFPAELLQTFSHRHSHTSTFFTWEFINYKIKKKKSSYTFTYYVHVSIYRGEYFLRMSQLVFIKFILFTKGKLVVYKRRGS